MSALFYSTVLYDTLSLRVPTRSDTKQAVPPQKMVRGLKFRTHEVEGLYYLCRGNKGADLQLHDGPDKKLFILVGWDRSFRLGPPELN